MSGIFFYTIGVAFTSGIFFRSFYDFGMSGLLFILVLSLLCATAWRVRKTEEKSISPLFLISIACLSFFFGAARMHVSETTPSFYKDYEDEEVLFVAKVVREPEIRETNTHLYVRQIYDQETISEVLLVMTSKYDQMSQDFSYGDIVVVEGDLERPKAFETVDGHVFNYLGYLQAKGVSYIVSNSRVTIQNEPEFSFLGNIFRGKKAFELVLERSIPEPYSGLGEGLLLGVKRALGQDLERIFRETGIIHIVVLSGYNIMIVVEAIMLILSFVFFPRTRTVLGIVSIVLFALLVGLSSTVVRASLMAILLIVARGTGRTYAVLRALMLAGVVMLIGNPYLLAYDPGFQLSFLATLGLILLVPHVEKYLTRIPSTFGMRGFITATVVTQFFVLPLLLYHMGLFSIVAVLVNVLILPVVPLAMLLTFLTGIFGFVSSTLGYFVGYVAYLSLGYIIEVARFFGGLPFASVTVQAFPFWIVVVVYVLYVFIITHFISREVKVIDKVSDETYVGWTLVDENTLSPETQSVSGDRVSNFPFR
ncbi:MAG: ComEC family competence protein [Candidatus Pacebacteria bacterium]|nr:ComEC family competence protein [Candidatus Paceibacterota bacterium]MCF7857455.1 ComEC family competence protein [Candidatus Paceibacterota bacterium]